MRSEVKLPRFEMYGICIFKERVILDKEQMSGRDLQCWWKLMATFQVYTDLWTCGWMTHKLKIMYGQTTIVFGKYLPQFHSLVEQ